MIPSKNEKKDNKPPPLCVACTYTVVMLFFTAYAIFLKYYVIGHSCYTCDCSLSLSHNTQAHTKPCYFI